MGIETLNINKIVVTNGIAVVNNNKVQIKYGDTVLKEYDISKITLNALLNNLDMQKGLIKGITAESKANILNDMTVTNGTISKLDKKNVPISDTSNLKTGDKLRITFSDNSYYDYTVSVKGDVVGSGEINIASVAKLYQYLKGVITMDEAYVEAGDLVGSDGIWINDVAKLYQYIKGTISTL